MSTIMSNTVNIGRFKFYYNFVDSYRGLNIVQARRKLKKYYTKSEQDLIISYLKAERILKRTPL